MKKATGASIILLKGKIQNKYIYLLCRFPIKTYDTMITIPYTGEKDKKKKTWRVFIFHHKIICRVCTAHCFKHLNARDE